MKRVEVLCSQCQVPLIRTPSKAHRNCFCSRVCYHIWKQGREQGPWQDRFWSYVSKKREHWTWTGSLVKGYGNLAVLNRGHVLAHRLSWEIHFGEIPEGLFVLHTCDIRSCVRPEHLFLGTDADNARDAASKGRLGQQKYPELYRGEKSPRAILTLAQVIEIRSRYVPREVTLQRLADEYGVSMPTIAAVVSGRNWGLPPLNEKHLKQA